VSIVSTVSLSLSERRASYRKFWYNSRSAASLSSSSLCWSLLRTCSSLLEDLEDGRRRECDGDDDEEVEPNEDWCGDCWNVSCAPGECCSAPGEGKDKTFSLANEPDDTESSDSLSQASYVVSTRCRTSLRSSGSSSAGTSLWSSVSSSALVSRDIYIYIYIYLYIYKYRF